GPMDERRHPYGELFRCCSSLLGRAREAAGAQVEFGPVQMELFAHWADLDRALVQVAALAQRFLESESEADRRGLPKGLMAAAAAERVLAQRLPVLTLPSAESA